MAALAMAAGLESLGWNVRRLGTLRDLDDEGLAHVRSQVEEKMERAVEVRELRELITIAGKAAEVVWKAEGRSASSEHPRHEGTSRLHQREKEGLSREVVGESPVKGKCRSTEVANSTAEEDRPSRRQCSKEGCSRERGEDKMDQRDQRFPQGSRMSRHSWS